MHTVKRCHVISDDNTGELSLGITVLEELSSPGINVNLAFPAEHQRQKKKEINLFLNFRSLKAQITGKRKLAAAAWAFVQCKSVELCAWASFKSKAELDPRCEL